MTDRINVQMEEGVAMVRLSRPDKRNALDMKMFEALIETGEGLAAKKGLRAVVLHGEGKGFCAGLDVMSFMATGSAEQAIAKLLEPYPGSPANFVQQTVHVWSAMPVPVIAALHGVVYGGGLQLALGADIRVAHPDAKLSVMEIKWGLIPDMTGSQTLRHLVGLDVAKLLTFTGKVVEGKEAQALGLVTEVNDEPLEHARNLARVIASKSPHAIRHGKTLLDASVGQDLEQGLALEATLQKEIIGRPNQLEAVTANMMKRQPAFEEV